MKKIILEYFPFFWQLFVKLDKTAYFLYSILMFLYLQAMWYFDSLFIENVHIVF